MTDFLVKLLNTPSPTGYYSEAMDYVHQAFAALEVPNLTLTTTPKGALLGFWKGSQTDKPRGMTAHVDTLGLMVKEIKGSGRLRTTQLGGYMWTAVEFEGVTVRTYSDQRYRGTLLPSNPSVHVNAGIRDAKREESLMEVRLDAKVNSADDVRQLGIEVGDFVFLDPRVEVTDTGFIRSRHLDDKAGVAVIYGALQALKDAGLRPAQDTTFLIANYEEVGHGGSSGFPDNLYELLAIDMGALGDGQAGDEFSASICVKDSSGPYHFMMNNKLRRLAETFEIAHKLDIYPYYGSDGSAYWRAGGQARVGLIGPGVDASHAYERTHQDSLYHSAHLIARYLLDDSE
ncbi:MAG: M42 family metallopeptidase [Anaerolineales bacterium]|nr:M42 family metallopeptidase [Anaerolineales bacterium]